MTGQQISIESVNEKPKNRKCPIQCFIEKKDGKKSISTKNVTKEEVTLFQELSGTPNKSLANSIVNFGVAALPKGLDDAEKHNIILQNLADSTPKDAHEARLSTQAAVLYIQGMDFLERARQTLFGEETFAKDHWHSILMKTATRLLDLHNKTIETLVRYRQRGEQKIVVQHVNIEGQAIVNNGNMIAGGGGK